MINTSSIAMGRDDGSSLDIRPRLNGRNYTGGSSLLTEHVTLSAESDWAEGDRLAEFSKHRYSHTERMLASVADCLVASYLIEATSRGVRVRSIQASVGGACEPMARPGFLSRLRSGPARLEVVLRIVADADDQTIGNLLVAAKKGSAAFDMLAGNVRVEVIHDKM